jgi:hypothetical protein
MDNYPSNLSGNGSSNTNWDMMTFYQTAGSAYGFRSGGSLTFSGSSSGGTPMHAIGINTFGFNRGASEAGPVEIGEIILYNRVLSSAEIDTVESYLRSKWGF